MMNKACVVKVDSFFFVSGLLLRHKSVSKDDHTESREIHKEQEERGERRSEIITGISTSRKKLCSMPISL